MVPERSLTDADHFSRQWMDVIVNGEASSRPVDHYAVAHSGNQLASQFGYPVPVLYEGEEIQRTIDGKVYIYSLSIRPHAGPYLGEVPPEDSL